MSMYDCPKCWEIICICGHEYKKWKIEKLLILKKIIENEFEARKIKENLLCNGKAK